MKTDPRPFLAMLAASLLLSAGLQAAAQAEELAPGYEACMRRAGDVHGEIDCLGQAEQWWSRQEEAALAKAREACGKSYAPGECRASLKEAQRLWSSSKEAMSEAFQNRFAGASGSTVQSMRAGIAMSRSRIALLKAFAGAGE